MRLEQLHHLLEIARGKSISSAAKKLGITQQSLSASLKKLEGEFGVAILERSTKGIIITPEGQVLVEMAKDVLKTIGKAKKQLQVEVPGTLSGVKVIKLFTMPAAYSRMLLSAVNASMGNYPQITVQILEKNLSAIVARLLEEDDLTQGIFSVGILNLSADQLQEGNLFPQELAFVPMTENKFLVCASVSSPLAAMKEVSISTLLKYPIILYNLAELAENTLYGMLSLYGKPEIALTVDNGYMAISYMDQNKGIGIISQMIYDQEFAKRHPTLRVIPLRENLATVVGYIYRKNRILPKEAKDFIRILTSYYQE